MSMKKPYPESCFTDLVGVRGTCDPVATAPAFWIDDIPGIDVDKLAKIATADAPSGATMGAKLVESAARLLAADTEGIYDGKYKVETNLVTGCSTCKVLTNYLAGHQRGIVVKDETRSAFSHLIVDKFTACVNQTGTFHIVLDDGRAPVTIEHDFVAGQRDEFVNVNFRTKAKSVRLYLAEDDVPLAQLSCPGKGSGCGCSGKARTLEDLHFMGTFNGADNQQAYGFVPCAYIACDAADLLCFLAHSAPRLIGMALLFKTAELYFSSTALSTRNNSVASKNVDDKNSEAMRYNKLYTDRLLGKGTRGIKDLVFSNLASVTDACVVCDALNKTQWATT